MELAIALRRTILHFFLPDFCPSLPWFLDEILIMNSLLSFQSESFILLLITFAV